MSRTTPLREEELPIYPERESKTLEFKSRLPDFRSLAKTCVAFANCAGGEIVIGVEDGTRRVIGIDPADRDKMYDAFPSSLYDLVSPSLIPHIYEKSIGHTSVLIIRIWPGDCMPYFIKSMGIPSGVFVRVGTASRPANQQTIDDLSRERRRTSFDEEGTEHPATILSRERLRDLYGRDTSAKRLLSDKVITHSPRSKNGFSVTNGGILMFCDTPDDYIAESFLVATRFAGNSGRSIVQTVDIKGPIPLIVESTFALIENWLERDLRLKRTKLRGTSLIPAEALREAIVNALVHRKYSIPGPVKVALFDDRLEVFSPGAFPGLVSIDSLGDGTTYLRNLVVARIARKMRIMEKLGTGIRLIYDSCKHAGLRKPEYNEGGDFVKVTFSFERESRTSEFTEESILQLIRQTDLIRPSELSDRFDVSRNTISRRLDGLVRKGVLKRYGKGAGVHYRISE